MGSLTPLTNWPDHALLTTSRRAFDITRPVIAHETGNDKARIAELDKHDVELTDLYNSPPTV